MTHGSATLSSVSLALLFALSCGKQAPSKKTGTLAPEDMNRDYLAEASAAKVSFGKLNQLNVEEAIGNPATAFTGRFGPQFNWPIIPAHVALLPNGKVFNYGTDGQGVQGANFNYDVWTPALGTETNSHQWLVNQTATDIFCGATAILPDSGDVLIPGGDTRYPESSGINSTLIFRKNEQNLERTAYMQFARWYPSAITLPNGETIIHGGRDGSSVPVATPEIYSNGQWRTLWGATNHDVISDEEGRWFYPRNWVAPDGKIFGMSGNRMYTIDWRGEGSAQVIGYLPNKSRSHTSTAVMYQPGKILQVGGSTNGDTQAEGSNQAITVDINGSTPNVKEVPNMAKRRIWANSTVLPNGEVLITGGSAFENRLVDTAEVAEIWNPDTRQFRQVATARTPRLYHSNNILLPDATVLVSGGGAPGPVNNLNGELYYPPYLFDVNGNYAKRLSIGTIGEKFGYNDNTNVPYFGAGRVKRVTLIRNGAVTHSFNVGQRFLELSFTELNGSVQVIMPNSPNIAPPGYYMLFLVNEAGVPSIAKIINLNNGQTAGPSQPQPESQPQTQPQTQPEEQPNVFVQRNLVVGEIYMVRSKASAKCMDVAAQGSDNGIAVQQYECNKTAAQSFRLIQNQNGGLSLANLNSNKCIDLAGVSKDNGGLVHQWDCLGTPNQTLNFAPQSDGSFQIRFAHSDRCLDVPAFSADNSVRLQQWDCGTGANQGFYLLK